jgi:hypothetical protein
MKHFQYRDYFFKACANKKKLSYRHYTGQQINKFVSYTVFQ